jgi:hypothetical protein
LSGLFALTLFRLCIAFASFKYYTIAVETVNETLEYFAFFWIIPTCGKCIVAVVSFFVT